MDNKYILLVVGLMCLSLMGCGKNELENEISYNSVSEYCEDNGGSSEFTELPDGNELGTCYFSDGSFCDIRDYKDGTCKPGDNATGISKIITKCSGKTCK